jgi:Legume lectin domain
MIRNKALFCAPPLACLLTLISLTPLALGQTIGIAPGGFSTNNVCAYGAELPASCQVITNGSPNQPQVLPSGTLRLNTANQNQHASAWFYTPQPLSTGFTTAFQFQITNTGACQGCSSPADGIALVIQGDPAGTQALGFTGNGQNISYGDDDLSGASGIGSAITNSLAVELDTYFNPDYSDPDANHIAVQSCGPNNSDTLSPNSADHGYICPSGQSAKIALQSLASGMSLSDGNPHTITVNYLPPANGCITGCNNLSIYFDSTLVLQATIDLTQQLYLTSTASNSNTPATGAYIGFTASTGGSVENNDILSWSFSQLPLAPITIPQPLQPTQTQFNYSPTLTASVDYSQSGLGSSAFTGVVMQGTSGPITDTQFANLVANTPFQGSTCLHQDLGSGVFSCVATTDLCTTSTNNLPAGANCPGTQSALIGTTNTFNADPSQGTIVNPGYIMGKDNALTNCGAGDNNDCKGLQNIFVSISGDPTMVGRTKDFNSILIPIEGVLQPSTSITTTPQLNQGWANVPVTVNFNSIETKPANNQNPPATYPTVSLINYSVAGVNLPSPASGTITGPTGSINIPATNQGATTVTYQGQDSVGTFETILTSGSGGVSTSLPMFTVNIDTINPTFNCTPPSPVWQITDVNVPCTASDNAGGSGLATPAAFAEMTAVPAGTETNMAQTTAVNVSDIAGNTVAAGPFGPFLVDKKAPVIGTPSLSAPAVFGQPATINFSCSDGGSGVVLCGPPGSATFAPVANTGTLSVGANTTSAGAKSLTLNSQDLVGNVSPAYVFNYNVAQATPVITWPQPAPIVYPTPLSPTQLNATATVGGNPVLGSLTYTPGVGAVLAPGTQTLKVTFVPSDTNDYATVVGQVTIAVSEPALNISPASLNFGTVYLGSPVFGTITVSNPGTAAVQISSMKLVRGTADADDYGALTNCPKTLKAGGACAIAVGFNADDLGLRTASIVITDSASAAPQQIPLSANVIKKGK